MAAKKSVKSSKPAAKAAAKPAATAAAAKPAAKPAAKAAAKRAAKPASKAGAKAAAKPAAKPAAKASAKPAAKAAAKAPKAKKAGLRISMLKPSVNNLAVRVFTRAAGLDFDEADAWGTTRSPEYLARNPAHLTPMIEEKGLPRGVLWESCAIMQYLSNKHGLEKFYPSAPARRAMVDSAMFYLIGTLYPYVARATYPALGFPQYAGEVGASDLEPGHKSAAQKAAMAAIAEPLEVFHSFFRNGKPFIGGNNPSIADIRLAATLEFLKVVDYALPAWARDYMAAIEKKLGKAYSEPAADVRGYIAHVKSQAGAGAKA
jgi:glutathione S-transferase